MSTFVRRIRPYALGLAVAAGIVAVAGAFTEDPFELIIVAPSDVIAGNPIDGYVTGNEGLTKIKSSINGIPIPELRGYCDPLHFTYPTFEPWAPGVFSIHASDFDEIAVRSVAIK